MSDVVADTHALIWYLSDPAKLSPAALAALENAALSGAIFIPTISVIEIHYLTEKGRIDSQLLSSVIDCLDDPDSALVPAPLSFEMAKTVGQIQRTLVPDMPDRIIAATAFTLGLPLVTSDHKIQSSGIQIIW